MVADALVEAVFGTNGERSLKEGSNLCIGALTDRRRGIRAQMSLDSFRADHVQVSGAPEAIGPFVLLMTRVTTEAFGAGS